MEQQQHELQGIYIKVNDQFHNINTLGQETYIQVLNIFLNLINEHNQRVQAEQLKQEEV